MLDVSRQIIVLADDLSGAAELAGIAFAHGLSAEVCRVGPAIADRAGPPYHVLAIDTDSRHLPAAAAAERVQQITAQALAENPAWLFKKVDSVLRGNVRAEIEAILEATGQTRAILIPANSSRGRVIIGGRYLIDGVPLDKTPFAHDPDHPRFSSDVLALLGPGSTENSIVSIPDVESPSQLDQFAVHCDATTLAAGAADFFAALLNARCRHKLLSPPAAPLVLRPPALLVCGSRSSWHQCQAACTAAGITHATIDDRLTESQPFGALLLGIGESVTPDPLPLLAQSAANILDDSAVATLLAEGGSTAAAIAQQMNWSQFTVAATAPAGIGVLKPLSDPASPTLFIKPGSYPWPPEIWDAFVAAAKH